MSASTQKVGEFPQISNQLMIGDSNKTIVFHTKVGTIRSTILRRMEGQRGITPIDDLQ
jgi:hypothetical protein